MTELQIGTDFTLDTDRFDDEGLRVGIFASPGAGKGYLLGVLLEELIGAGYPAVMVDPESELWTFRETGALVIGGPHGHAPFVSSAEVIDEALRFCFETATPVVFDLGDFESDERDALLFLVGRNAFVTINAVALALSGSDSGSVRGRWTKVLQSLVAKGLVSVGGSGRSGRRDDVEGYVRRGLSPHAATDAEVAQVRDRALYVLQAERA